MMRFGNVLLLLLLPCLASSRADLCPPPVRRTFTLAILVQKARSIVVQLLDALLRAHAQHRLLTTLSQRTGTPGTIENRPTSMAVAVRRLVVLLAATALMWWASCVAALPAVLMAQVSKPDTFRRPLCRHT